MIITFREVTMKPIKIAKAALGTSAVILALTLAPAAVASASPAVFVLLGWGSCIGHGHHSGRCDGRDHQLGPWLHLLAHVVNNGGGMTGFNGLPVVTNAITINGFFTTIAANDTNFRIFEVNGPGGNLTFQGLTITGGNSFGGDLER